MPNEVWHQFRLLHEWNIGKTYKIELAYIPSMYLGLLPGVNVCKFNYFRRFSQILAKIGPFIKNRFMIKLLHKYQYIFWTQPAYFSPKCSGKNIDPRKTFCKMKSTVYREQSVELFLKVTIFCIRHWFQLIFFNVSSFCVRHWFQSIFWKCRAFVFNIDFDLLCSTLILIHSFFF
jgi:hypothetical protein